MTQRVKVTLTVNGAQREVAAHPEFVAAGLTTAISQR